MLEAPSRYTMGLRFTRSQVRTLRNLIERVGHIRRPDFDPSLFVKALESTEQGEPLIVECSHPAEAEQMADGFIRWGIKRPTVEELTR